jgi:hypothetical protein
VKRRQLRTAQAAHSREIVGQWGCEGGLEATSVATEGAVWQPSHSREADHGALHFALPDRTRSLHRCVPRASILGATLEQWPIVLVQLIEVPRSGVIATVTADALPAPYVSSQWYATARVNGNDRPAITCNVGRASQSLRSINTPMMPTRIVPAGTSPAENPSSPLRSAESTDAMLREKRSFQETAGKM